MCVHAPTQKRATALPLRHAAISRDGSVVVTDNLRIPGAPDYVKWMKTAQDFTFEQHSVCLGASALWLHDIIGVSVYHPTTPGSAAQT
jgi:hypothetical protein